MRLTIQFNNGETVEGREMFASSMTELTEVISTIQKAWYAEQVETIKSRLSEELATEIREEVEAQVKDDLLEDENFTRRAADKYVDNNCGEYSSIADVLETLGEVEVMREAFYEIRRLAEDYEA